MKALSSYARRMAQWTGSAFILLFLCAGANLSAAELSDAEKAWDEFQAASRLPAPPQQGSREEMRAFNDKAREILATAAVKAREFYTKFPDDPNAGRAKRKEYEFLNKAASFGDATASKRLEEMEKSRLTDPKLDDNDRYKIRFEQVKRNASAKQTDGPAAVMAELEKGARELLKEFPNQADPYEMLFMVAQQSEPDKGRKIFEELLKEPKSGQELKERAAGMIKKFEVLGKPLDIQFEAVDGRKVNLADLKGKVVLIDFWATWCGPCVAELPNVLKAYESLHPKGFEIVGISFDQSKEALTKFVADKKMPWPQYFDGKGWANKYGKEYGINGIPAMWLVDKKGNLVDMNGRGDLEAKVEKLLAE